MHGPETGIIPLRDEIAYVVQVLFSPALRYSPLGDLEPPQDTGRATCAHLLGLCYFLPSVLAGFPGALSFLLLLASACFLPSRPCSHLGFHCPHLSLCVVLCVDCCPFLAFCFFAFGPLCLVSATEVTKIAEGCLPHHHTHTATVTSSPLRVSVGGWLVLNSFVRLFVLAVPLARLSCSIRLGFSWPEPWTRLHCSELHEFVLDSIAEPLAATMQCTAGLY